MAPNADRRAKGAALSATYDPFHEGGGVTPEDRPLELLADPRSTPRLLWKPANALVERPTFDRCRERSRLPTSGAGLRCQPVGLHQIEEQVIESFGVGRVELPTVLPLPTETNFDPVARLPPRPRLLRMGPAPAHRQVDPPVDGEADRARSRRMAAPLHPEERGSDR